MKSPRLLVMGGGIGGLATALAASAAGCEVQVLEKAETFAEIGAGLQLAPNASRVLEKLGILDDVRKHGCFPPRLVFMDAISGKELTSVEAGRQFTERYGYPYFVVHRADLLDAEVTACRQRSGVNLIAGKEVISVEDKGDKVLAVCADGSSYEADALIGADGLWSTARKYITEKRPICSEFVAYRGTTAPERIPRREGLDNMTIWIGPDLHLVQYPLRTGHVYNQVAVFRSLRYRPGMEAHDDWGTSEEFVEAFSKTCDYLKSCVPLLDHYRRWPMYFAEPLTSWTKGRITLLGDAAIRCSSISRKEHARRSKTPCVWGESSRRMRTIFPRRFTITRRPGVLARRACKSARFDSGKLNMSTGSAARFEIVCSRCELDDLSELDWLYGEGLSQDA